MVRKMFFATVVATSIGLSLLVGCGSNSSDSSSDSTTADGETYIMRIAHNYNSNNTIGKYFEDYLIPEIEEKSGGRIVVQEFSNGALGTETDQITMCQLGDIAVTNMGESSAALNPAMINIWCLPFLFESEEQWDQVVDGGLGDEIMNLAGTGLEVVGFMENGFRQVTSNYPIQTIDDLKGLKIRTSNSAIMLNTFEKLGAAPISMSFNELFSALETGTVDAQENPYNTIYSSGFYEVQKYVAVTNHVLSTQWIVVNHNWIQSLPEDLQTILYECFDSAEESQHQQYRASEALDREACLSSGMIETNPELDAFIQAVQPVYEEYYQQYPESEEIIKEILALKG